MIRRDGDSVLLEGALTLGTVSEVAGAVEEHLREGARVVDFRGVTDVDSAALALALEWLRQTDGKTALRYANLPVAMQNLAQLYGVSEILRPAAA